MGSGQSMLSVATARPWPNANVGGSPGAKGSIKGLLRPLMRPPQGRVHAPALTPSRSRHLPQAQRVHEPTQCWSGNTPTTGALMLFS